MKLLLRWMALLLVTLAPVVARCAGPDDEDFVTLFDGKSLESWVQRGGQAIYQIEQGAIVGTSVAKTPNSFLCTPRDYRDFVLTFEVKIDKGLNSGVQFRSLCFDEASLSTGAYPNGKPFKKRIPAGRVHGYQVEIDPSPRAFSGGVYDEARRGWLDKPDGKDQVLARHAFHADQWNRYRVEAHGESIRTWVNDIPVADFTDDMTPAGFIGLQVHSVGSADQVGKQVRWRNLRIREL